MSLTAICVVENGKIDDKKSIFMLVWRGFILILIRKSRNGLLNRRVSWFNGTDVWFEWSDWWYNIQIDC